MGLPAFDMTAFEAALSANTSAPRVSTSIFVGPGVASHATADERRKRLRRSTDALVREFDQWRGTCLVGIARLRALFNSGLRLTDLNFQKKIHADLLSHIEKVRENVNHNVSADLSVLEDGKNFLEEKQSNIPINDLRFARQEIRRFEAALQARHNASERLIYSMEELATRLGEAIALDSVKTPLFGTEEERSVYLDHALSRRSDEGVAGRTARRLKQFPKVAAHLAR